MAKERKKKQSTMFEPLHLLRRQATALSKQIGREYESPRRPTLTTLWFKLYWEEDNWRAAERCGDGAEMARLQKRCERLAELICKRLITIIGLTSSICSEHMDIQADLGKRYPAIAKSYLPLTKLQKS